MFVHEVAWRRTIVQWKTDDKLEILNNFFSKNDNLLNADQVKIFARNLMEDLTFLEVYERNGWILNITATDYRTNQLRLCNYLTTPDVLIWSAMVASCSIPEIFGTQELYIKDERGNILPYHQKNDDGLYKYVDGSFSADLPIDRIGRMFNVTTFIVSQVNPHGIPLSWNLRGAADQGFVSDVFLVAKKLLFNNIMFFLEQAHLLKFVPRDLINMRNFALATIRGDI